MMESLKKGDEVVTSGGIVGKITKVGESYVTTGGRQAGGGQGRSRKRRDEHSKVGGANAAAKRHHQGDLIGGT